MYRLFGMYVNLCNAKSDKNFSICSIISMKDHGYNYDRHRNCHQTPSGEGSCLLTLN